MYHELKLPLAFYYDTKQPVPIPDVIKSLSALDRLSKGLPAFLSTLSGADIDSCELKVSRIESGSLKETLDVALRFLTAAEKTKFETWLKTTKMGKGIRYAAFGGLLATAVLVVASSSMVLVDKLGGNSTPSIQASHSVVMVAGQDMFNVSRPELEAAISAAMAIDKKKIATASLDFISPAAGGGGGALFAGDDNKGPVSISEQAVRDAPAKPDFSIDDQELQFTNVTIDIRTLNRDSDQAGWVAKVPSVGKNKKLPMSFAPGVNYNKAFSSQFIQADITVTYSQTPKGSLVPKSFVVTAVY
ncbi:hypothetical protein ACRS3X_03650 [Ectopseudomonas hydrolytica]|uniref:hypothetical protein n=1 Tax=Ectopseudomonas hydrolytica TaxID=2493633 RepID=UPI003EE0140E